MAKKEVTGYVKLQIKGGQANPAPPVGPALGQRGINIMEFCKAFNEKTKDFMGKPVPVDITVYKDKKFNLIIKETKEELFQEFFEVFIQNFRIFVHACHISFCFFIEFL